jgi:alpha-2-macroglobulin
MLFKVSAFCTIALTFLLSCNRNLVNLDFTNAKDEVAPLTNLVFRFDKTLIADSLINHWDSTKYVSFEPAIAGKFRWEHGDELVFSPSTPLLPATSYRATLNSDILQYSKYDHFGNAKDIQFHTAELKLENSNSSWVLQDESSKTYVPQLELIFNYAVDPSQLKEKLKLTLDDKPVSFSLQTLSASDKISIRLANIPAADKDYEIKIQLDKGLIPVGGMNGTAEMAAATAMIPSPFILRINGIEASPEGSGGTITIATSQKIISTNLASYLTIEPAVKFNTEITETGFTIQSDQFNVDKSYQLTIRKGLRGQIGGTLSEDYINNLAFGTLEPDISFQNKKGIYLSGKGEKNMEVRITNVEKVKILISRIYENNLLIAQRSGYYPREKNMYSNEYDDNADFTAGDVIYEKEINTSLLPKYGNSRLLHLDMEDKLPDFKGIYHILIRSTKDYWVKDSRFLSLSDIGIIAKQGTENVVVFANSIQTASPIKGVNMTAYGSNNQILGMATTDEQGVATIKYQRREFAGFKPAMIIAKTGDDFNYLPFSSTLINTSRFDVSGKILNTTGLDAFIYPERDIYRPGETIHYSVIVRDYSWKSPGEIPVKLKFLYPNGKELKSFRKTLNEQGSVEGNIDLPVTAITGTYSLEIYTSTDVLLSTQPFHVEEFVPDRIKVTASLNKEFYEPGNTAEIKIQAVNFFGPPASGRNYECEIQLKQKTFSAKKFNNYDFGLTNQKSFYDKVTREGKTNEAGETSEKFRIEDIYKNVGLLQADFYSTVFDETGRPVSRLTSANIYTQPIYFGIANDGSWYYPLNQPVGFHLLALDKDQLVITANAEVSVVKHEYRTVISRNGSYFRYESQEEDKLISSKIVPVGGEQTSFSFVPRTAGEYELRVTIPGSNTFVSKSFYSFGSWGSDNASFEINNEGHVDIQLDKSSYFNGESVRALFKAPFDGRMLVTLETDKLISYQWINVEKRSASVELKLSAEAVPNAYITATLIKPHGITDIPLTVAHGFENVGVQEKSRKIQVEIIANQKVRSRTQQQVKIKAAPNSLVTLAAVDNGVLQVSDFKTPDPYGYFYARRALGVTDYDIYPLLLPELRARLSSTGGDTETDMTKRTNPMPAKRIKILSYWSGIKKADGNGEAIFQVDIPQFSGEIRLMAISYRSDQFGSAESKMTVADPLVLSTSLPRFLSPADSISVPVTITNTTTSSASGSATLNATGGVLVSGSKELSFTIPPNSEKRLHFNVSAAPVIGTGKISVDITGPGGRFSDETEISIRPASSLQKTTGSGSIAGGSAETIHYDNADYIPSSISRQLFLTRFPGAGLSKYLGELLEYPYGCTEQTVSIAFPQLYFGELSDALHVTRGNRSTANYNVQEAIRKIKMRQLYTGAVTLWDDEKTADWWTSIYAAHFLIEANKAGFDVDKSLLETLLGYINSSLKDRRTINYYYNRDQVKRIVPKEVIYGLYVLALASRPNTALMNYYKATPSLLSLDCKYLLAAAYALSGDKNSYQQFLPTHFTGEIANTETGGSFSSDIRDEAMSLDVLLTVDPSNAQIPEMAKHISDNLKQRSWYNTQELVFGFLALGKISRLQGISTATAEVKIDGKKIADFNGADLKLPSSQLKNGKTEIAAAGRGNLYYFWEEEGISAGGTMKETDNYLKVRKRFFDRNGNPISGNVFKQNELIIVQISLEKTFSNDIQNVVITDLLPAGFEIENPRTKDIPGMEWIKDAYTPTALDVRDDRINLFVNSDNLRQNYYYAVRAVSPGVYKMGPVSADAMYDGEYHSYNGAGTIQVVE